LTAAAHGYDCLDITERLVIRPGSATVPIWRAWLLYGSPAKMRVKGGAFAQATLRLPGGGANLSVGHEWLQTMSLNI